MHDLQDAFRPQTERIAIANDTLALIEDDLSLIKPEEGAYGRAAYRECKRFTDELEAVEKRIKVVKLLVLEHQFNAYWYDKLKRRYDLSDYAKKREVAKELNDDLRHYGCSIRHPEHRTPCIVLATSSPDGKGRYVLSDKVLKKRSHTSQTLFDLLPLKLMPEPRRKESFLKRKEETAD